METESSQQTHLERMSEELFQAEENGGEGSQGQEGCRKETESVRYWIYNRLFLLQSYFKYERQEIPGYQEKNKTGNENRIPNAYLNDAQKWQKKETKNVKQNKQKTSHKMVHLHPEIFITNTKMEMIQIYQLKGKYCQTR